MFLNCPLSLDSFRNDLSYFLPLLVGFNLIEVGHGGRLSAMGYDVTAFGDLIENLARVQQTEQAG